MRHSAGGWSHLLVRVRPWGRTGLLPGTGTVFSYTPRLGRGHQQKTRSFEVFKHRLRYTGEHGGLPQHDPGRELLCVAGGGAGPACGRVAADGQCVAHPGTLLLLLPPGQPHRAQAHGLQVGEQETSLSTLTIIWV